MKKNQITTQIILDDKFYSNLKDCLTSVSKLNGIIFVYSNGNKNDKVCSDFGVEIIKGDATNRSEIRNDLINKSETEWNLYIEPWEKLYNPGKILGVIEKEEDDVYNLLISKGGVITKDARLWKNKDLRFENPIFEAIYAKNAKNLDCFIKSEFENDSSLGNKIQKWIQTNPASPRPYYYQAFYNLANKNYNTFIQNAEEYLARDNKAHMSTIMMKYYYASILCYVKKDIKKAVNHILGCLAIKPLMSEFWCLLGDATYSIQRDYHKAKRFYENAIILGRQRDMNDDWPIEINKYKNYPNEMISNCESLYGLSRIYMPKN